MRDPSASAKPKSRNRKPPISPSARGSRTRPSSDTASHSPKTSPSGHATGFPVVGVGASAGGLEAFTQLLKHLPLDTGMGFVLVQHLDPQHESALSQILTRTTSLPVQEATNNLRVQANHVYIIPPNTSLGIAKGVLKLQPRPQTRTPARSIDAFFEALAQDQHERAIGVILSGTATDGTLGLEAIKAEGGLTFAQDQSARYDSMPRSAIAAGCVDFVLKPEDIAAELARIAKHPYVAGQPPGLLFAGADRASATAPEADETPLPSAGHGAPHEHAKRVRRKTESADAELGGNGYKKILLLLRNHSGVDFSLYKSTTIQRRITRRIVLNKQNTLEEYSHFLKGNAKELDALYSDVLISVTSFFRNPDSFELLKRKVFPKLLQQRGSDPIRVWVLGCSTGQEAYSIAMAFIEAAENAPRLRKLQIFATDLNDAMLDKARHGLYAKNLAEDVSPDRLRRFFVEEEAGYRVVKPLREMVVFARQNLINDPPFSRMDLISCRNLLIYLQPNLQQKVIPTFHYALKPEGVLFLGASESIGGFNDLFEPADKKHKIYSKKPATAHPLNLPLKRERSDHPSPGARPQLPIGKGKSEPPEGFRGELNAQREADRVSVNQFVPPGVLVNAEFQILQFRGPTAAYLQPPPSGKATFDVLKMARDGLMLPLRAALNKAKKENKTARKENVRVPQNGKSRAVNLEVIPLKNLRERCFLILFEDAERPRSPASERTGPPARPAAKPPVTKKEERGRIHGLESELSETRDYLQSIQEQHEAANEELQASNEEVQSANEELQSINEELETSKEELESANEELTTVNEEMANRNTELNRLNADLSNLQTSTRLPILLLGRDLIIRRFSASAEKIFNLLTTDLGRPLSEIRHNLVVPLKHSASALARQHPEPYPVDNLAREVIDTVREQEREVLEKDGRWYSLRARPYMTVDNKVDGAVLVLLDITDLKRSEEESAAARRYAEATIRTARDPLVVLRADLRVNTANDAFYKTFQTTPEQTEGRLIYDLGNEQWKIPKLRLFLEDILPRNSIFNDFEVTHDFPHIGPRTMLLNGRRLQLNEGAPPMILLAIEDVTERVRLDERVRMSEIRFRRIFEAAHDGVLILDSLTRKIKDANPFITNLLGYTREELLGKELWQIGLLKDEQSSHAAFRELQQNRQVRYEDLPLQTKSGEKREVEVMANCYDENHTQVIQCNIRDITDRKRSEQAVRESREQLAAELSGTQRLQETSTHLIHGGEIEGLYQQILAAAIAIMRSDMGSLQMFHPDRGELQLLAWKGFDPASAAFWEWVRPDSGSTCGVALRTEKRVIAPDVETFDPLDGTEDLQAYRKSGIRAVQSTPLVSRPGKVVGMISTHWRHPHHPAEGELRLLDVLARQAADLIERSQTEGARTRLAAIVESSDDAIISKDLNGVITSWNNGAEHLFGYTAAEAIGRPVTILMPPDRINEEPGILARIRRGESVKHYETVRQCKNGVRLDVSLTVSPLRNEQGQVVGASKIVRDITERKRTEESLRQAQAQLANRAAQLEELVTERTARLQETIGELEHFSYTITHDMRAPLRALQGFGGMLLSQSAEALSPESADYLQRIIGAAGRMDALIRDSLQYAKIVREKLPLVRVDPLPILRGILQSYPTLQPPHVEIKIVEPLPPVIANEAGLTQCFSNLLANAIKFVKPGKVPYVRVSAETRRDLVRFWLKDNGIGIPEEYQDRIFGMFQQLDKSYEGTGIGLALVRKTAERMNGKVGVESELGKGSRFWLEFKATE